MSANFLKNSAIIAAHPDDEVLWFSSILANVDQVVTVYQDYWAQPEIGANRARALADFPHDNILSLEIEEAGTYGCADWNDPKLNQVGAAFTHTEKLRSVKLKLRKAISRETAEAARNVSSIGGKYADNYHLIREKLKPLLADKENVFTHNPWGEYGHEDHLQVHQAVKSLRQELGFKMWMSNYCSNRSFAMATRYFTQTAPEYVTLPTDRQLADEIADLYKSHNCWTWADQWDWYESESFMETPMEPAISPVQSRMFPLNMICFPAKAA